VRVDLFQPTAESEARLLLLIEAFSRGPKSLEGRTKLAKLDFFLRYPQFLKRALDIKGATETPEAALEQQTDIEAKMVRFRYGPWDPAYFAILGRLVGKGLVIPVPLSQGIGYKATDRGKEVAKGLDQEPAWEETVERIRLLHKHFNLQGKTLMKFIYDNFPEVTSSAWGDNL
jgi:hypothetical protein